MADEDSPTPSSIQLRLAPFSKRSGPQPPPPSKPGVPVEKRPPPPVPSKPDSLASWTAHGRPASKSSSPLAGHSGDFGGNQFTRSSVSAVSMTSRSERYQIRGPEHNPFGLPPLPPRRSKEEVQAHEQKYNAVWSNKSTWASLSDVLRKSSGPNVPMRSVLRGKPASALPARNASKQEQGTPIQEEPQKSNVTRFDKVQKLPARQSQEPTPTRSSSPVLEASDISRPDLASAIRNDGALGPELPLKSSAHNQQDDSFSLPSGPKLEFTTEYRRHTQQTLGNKPQDASGSKRAVADDQPRVSDESLSKGKSSGPFSTKSKKWRSEHRRSRQRLSTMNAANATMESTSSAKPLVSRISYEGYLFTVGGLDTSQVTGTWTGSVGRTIDWAKAKRTWISKGNFELYSGAVDFHQQTYLDSFSQYHDLRPHQQALVRQLVAERCSKEEDPDAEWTLFSVEKLYTNHKNGDEAWKIISAMQVIIRRQQKTSEMPGSRKAAYERDISIRTVRNTYGKHDRRLQDESVTADESCLLRKHMRLKISQVSYEPYFVAAYTTGGARHDGHKNQCVSQPTLNPLPIRSTPKTKLVDRNVAADKEIQFGLVDDLVSEIMTDFGLRSSVVALSKNPDLSVRDMLREMGREIQSLGFALQDEASSGTKRFIATAIMSQASSAYAAARIISRVYDSDLRSLYVIHADKSREIEQSSCSTHSLEDDAVVRQTFFGDLFVKSLVTNSIAYNMFRIRMFELTHRCYEDKVHLALGHSLMARELSWVPVNMLEFSHGKSSSSLDWMQGLIEQCMGESWNWWPLSPRVCRLKPGFCRLQWKSPCGRTRYIDIPDAVKADIQHVLRTAPAWMNIEYPTDTRVHAPHGTANTTAGTGSVMAASTLSGTGVIALSPSLPASSPQQAYQPNHTSPTTSQSFHTAIATGKAAQLEQYLSFCITTSSREFVSLECNSLKTDLALYAKMKHEYDRARGRLRLWFSMWQYDHCEFVLFKKYGFNRGTRLQIGFPKWDDNQYEFIPRNPVPAPPDGPISRDEFRDHYYLDHCPSFYTWRRYQYRRKGFANKVIREALDAVPKRKTRVDMEDGSSELFYGLQAAERRSFFRVAVYACLCNLPGVIFFFLWLFQWAHASDLQNASVPLTLSLSLTLGFAAVVFGTREGT